MLALEDKKATQDVRSSAVTGAALPTLGTPEPLCLFQTGQGPPGIEDQALASRTGVRRLPAPTWIPPEVRH